MTNIKGAEVANIIWDRHSNRSARSPESLAVRHQIVSSDITGIISKGFYETVVNMGGNAVTLPTRVVRELRPELF